MKTQIKRPITLVALTSALVMWVGAQAIAEETTGEKVQTKIEGTQNDAKQTGRKVKKKVRDATGNSSVTEDMKDGAKNVGDDIEHGVKKTKRKMD